jgi:hypothetical protein
MANTFYVDNYCNGTVVGNTDGFAKLAAAVRAAGGGIIEFGAAKTYTVGYQARTPSGPWAYSYAEMLNLHGCPKGIIIRGNGSKIVYASGLRFGTFRVSDGQAYTPVMPYWGNDLAFPAYAMIRLADNTGPVHIENLELDGNVAGFVIGGTYGDTGYQAPGDGIYLQNNTGGMHVENVLCHHFPRDGVQIGDVVSPNTPRLNGLFVNVECESNCRQGVSMVGGRGYTFIGCKFNNTGRNTPISSAPGAGIDMEQEQGVIRDISFLSCEFVNNYGPGILTVGDCRDINVKLCTLTSVGWNFNLGGAIRVVFEQCTLIGSGTSGGPSSIPQHATKFIDCLFTDDPALMPPGMSSAQFGSKYCPDLGGGSENILFERCRWDMVGAGGLPYSYSNTIYRDCSFKNTRGPSVTLGRFEGVNHAEGPIYIDGSIFVGKFTHGNNTYRERASAYGPVSLPPGGSAGLTVDSSFAEVGDYVAVSHSHDIFGVILHAYIYRRHTIFVRFQNDTGRTIDLPAGTVYTKVISRHA